MADFVKGGTARAPFGVNEYLRSTQDVKKDSYTMAKGAIPVETIDGDATQKVLQPGTILAKITSGADAGKVGVYERGAGGGNAAVNEVQALTRTSTGGTITLSFEGQVTGTIPASAAGFTAAAVQAALLALPNLNVGDVTVAGAAGGPLSVTFAGGYAGQDVAALVVDNTSATGGTIVQSTTTPGSAASAGTGAATDGRADPVNIIGINDTFLPWQLMERDVEVAVTYEATVRQAWCLEYENGVRSALSNQTRDAILALPGMRLNFK